MSLRKRLRGRVIDAYLGEKAVSLGRRVHRLVGAPKIELYFQVDDPYSYLLAQVLGPLVTSAGLELVIVIVPPPAADVDTEPELRLGYAMRDARQLAVAYELSFPEAAQPPQSAWVEMANEILCAYRPSLQQLELAIVVGDAIWSGDEDALRVIAKREGTRSAASMLRRNERLRRQRGHYQSGMLRYAGQWYWGIDRLRHLRRHLHEEGREAPELRVTHAAVGGTAASELEMFFSFRSPYSYVAAVRAIAMCEAHDVALRIRPVLPMVMRGHTVPLVKRLYIARDTAREARWFDVPFGNLCDPLGPGIERCMAVFFRAREMGRERALVTSLGRGIWAEARDVARDEDLRELVERAEVPWADACAAIEANTWQAEVEGNREALYALGLWGVPSFRLGDFTVWGNDRLDLIERRLAAK